MLHVKILPISPCTQQPWDFVSLGRYGREVFPLETEVIDSVAQHRMGSRNGNHRRGLDSCCVLRF